MKVIKSDLTNISTIISAIETDITDTETLIQSLDDFVTDLSSKKLDGQVFEAVKTRVIECKTRLTSRYNTATALKSELESAVSKMSNFMGGYEKLDDSELSTLEQTVSNAQTNINNIIEESETEEDVKKILNYRVRMLRYQAIVDTTNIEIAKLKQLPEADNQAYALIQNSGENITTYNNSVNSLLESKIDFPVISV